MASTAPAFPRPLIRAASGTVRARHRRHPVGRAARPALPPLSHEAPYKKNKKPVATLHHSCPTVTKPAPKSLPRLGQGRVPHGPVPVLQSPGERRGAVLVPADAGVQTSPACSRSWVNFTPRCQALGEPTGVFSSRKKQVFLLRALSPLKKTSPERLLAGCWGGQGEVCGRRAAPKSNPAGKIQPGLLRPEELAGFWKTRPVM